MIKLLTIPEVAKVLGVSRAHVYDYINNPENPLPLIRLSPGTVRVDEEKLEAWLAGVFMDSNLEVDSDSERGEE